MDVGGGSWHRHQMLGRQSASGVSKWVDKENTDYQMAPAWVTKKVGGVKQKGVTS